MWRSLISIRTHQSFIMEGWEPQKPASIHSTGSHLDSATSGSVNARKYHLIPGGLSSMGHRGAPLISGLSHFSTRVSPGLTSYDPLGSFRFQCNSQEPRPDLRLGLGLGQE